MANWCYNTVSFTGDKGAVKKVVELFASMEQKENETKEAQIPEFMSSKDARYFFSICSYDEASFSWESKWAPNLEEVTEIAKKFDVNFIMTYEELGCNLFGKAIYTAGNDEAADYFLTDDDFDKYDFDEEKGAYVYNNEEYDGSDDILMEIFEQKFGFAF